MSILILPGNYTRVENKSVSGRSFSADINLMFQLKHAVVDVLTSIDLLEDMGLWKENNLLMGYCLGGMISTIVVAIDSRILYPVYDYWW